MPHLLGNGNGLLGRRYNRCWQEPHVTLLGLMTRTKNKQEYFNEICSKWGGWEDEVRCHRSQTHRHTHVFQSALVLELQGMEGATAGSNCAALPRVLRLGMRLPSYVGFTGVLSG